MSKLLSESKVNEKMNILSKNWSIDGLFLKGSYEFKNFDQAFNFMKVVAVKCEEINHHPKSVSYTHLTLPTKRIV